jgi:hypothetical protein
MFSEISKALAQHPMLSDPVLLRAIANFGLSAWTLEKRKGK